MQSPAKYTVYDETGKYIKTVKAEDANNYIDPSLVQERINNVSSVLDEQIGKIQKALLDIVDDANQAIIINDTSMGSQIDELVVSLEGIKGTASTNFEELYTTSIASHDSIQTSLNTNAKNTAWSVTGASKVV